MTRLAARAALACLSTAAAALVLAAPARAVSASPQAAGPAPHGAASAAPAPQTLADLDTAMTGEAYANASYTFYAAQADREHLPVTAGTYRRTASTELNDHFRAEAALAGVVRGDADNLRAAIAGEAYETTTMYPTFARQATADGDDNAAALFTEIAHDEAAHLANFQAALHVVETGLGRIPAPPPVDAVQVPAGGPQVHSARTLANLDTTMHGEALAHARYTLYGEHATADGRPALGRLFQGTGQVELREHFAGEAALYGLVGTTRQNLTRTVAGETYEATVMYPTFAARADAAGDHQAARVFRHNATDEATHARTFQQLLNHPH
ncbi:rubrerythrin family protein [Streptomyces sp. NPDC021224]|uniref:rubrerythrin family protein n=1 Tax=unclassified Streptomyces TaxID=2593676 RepID=UPI0037AB3AB5